MGLDEFLKQNSTEKAEVEEQKRIEIINAFKALVETLYSTIKDNWLREYIENGQISVIQENVNITEDKLGTYQAQSMKITFSNRMVELIPKGTIMLGTDARIDVCYLGIARKMIVRAPEKMTSALQMVDIRIEGEKSKQKKDLGQKEWKLVDPANRKSLLPLKKEVFQQLLVNIVTNA